MVEPHKLGGETGQKRKYLSSEEGEREQSRTRGFFPITTYDRWIIGDPQNRFSLTESFYSFKSVSFASWSSYFPPHNYVTPCPCLLCPASSFLTHNSIHFPPSAASTALTASAASRAYYSIAGAVSNWHLT